MRKNLHTMGAVTAPVIPVTVMAMMVTEGMPPICAETTEPMGMVMDLGKMESMSVRLSPSSLQKDMTHAMEVRLPMTMPARMGFQ